MSQDPNGSFHIIYPKNTIPLSYSKCAGGLYKSSQPAPVPRPPASQPVSETRGSGRNTFVFRGNRAVRCEGNLTIRLTGDNIHSEILGNELTVTQGVKQTVVGNVIENIWDEQEKLDVKGGIEIEQQQTGGKVEGTRLISGDPAALSPSASSNFKPHPSTMPNQDPILRSEQRLRRVSGYGPSGFADADAHTSRTHESQPRFASRGGAQPYGGGHHGSSRY